MNLHDFWKKVGLVMLIFEWRHFKNEIIIILVLGESGLSIGHRQVNFTIYKLSYIDNAICHLKP